MGSKLRDIRAAVITAIAGVNGSGEYDHDLSGAGQVLHGRTGLPARLPAVLVFGASSATTREDAQLGYLTRPHTWSIVGAVAAISTAPGDGEAEAEDLFDDISRALEADPTLGDLVYDLSLSLDETWGADLNLEMLAGFGATLTILRETAYGAGT
jgi:hypothetical protein